MVPARLGSEAYRCKPKLQFAVNRSVAGAYVADGASSSARSPGVFQRIILDHAEFSRSTRPKKISELPRVPDGPIVGREGIVRKAWVGSGISWKLTACQFAKLTARPHAAGRREA